MDVAQNMGAWCDGPTRVLPAFACPRQRRSWCARSLGYAWKRLGRFQAGGPGCYPDLAILSIGTTVAASKYLGHAAC